MTFLYPMTLWALALPLLLAAFLLWRRARTQEAWQQLVSPAHEQELVKRTPAWRSTLPALLALLALTGGIFAAARPINGYENSEAVATGRNLLIALDVSRSMETQDIKPSRLEEARAAAYELVDALPGDKIGLIVFSGEADLVVPLTYDHKALRDTLEQVDRTWAGYGGTNFGLVLKKAMQDFERSAPTGTNALVIFSDGEDTVGSSIDIAKEAREKKLLVITVGVGTAVGDSIPDTRGENGLYQNAEGKHVISKLDADALRRFSEATGGDYFQMGKGVNIVSFAQEAVKKLDLHEESFSGHKVPRDLFAPLAALSLLMLLASIVLGTEWRGSRGGAALLLLGLFLAASPAGAAPSEESLQAYSEGFALMEEDADKAREAFARALLDEDEALQAACLYQLGNMGARATFGRLRGLYGQGAPEEGEGEEEGLSSPSAPAPQAQQPTPEQLEEIVAALEKDLVPYRDALGIEPGMAQATANVAKIEELIRRLQEEIERLRQQQEQEQQQQEQQQEQSDEQKDESDEQQQDGNQQDESDEQQQDGDDQKDESDEQQQQQDGDDQKDESDEQQQDGDQQDQQQQDPQQDKQQQGENKDQQGEDQQKKQDAQGGQQQDDPQRKQPQQPQDKGQPLPFQRPDGPKEKLDLPQLSDEEKSKQRAASILQMHLDEEKGSPIPHFNDTVRPPEKDY